MKNLVSRVMAAAGSGTLSVVAVFGGGGATFAANAPSFTAAPHALAVFAVVIGALCYRKLQNTGRR